MAACGIYSLQKQKRAWNCNSFFRYIFVACMCNLMRACMHITKYWAMPQLEPKCVCRSFILLILPRFLFRVLGRHAPFSFTHAGPGQAHPNWVSKAGLLTNKHGMAPLGKSFSARYIIFILVTTHVPRIFWHKVKGQVAELMKFGTDVISQQLVVHCFYS